MYSEKATKFCEISTLLLSYVVPVKSKGKISKNFVAFSEYMNFMHTYGRYTYGFRRINLLTIASFRIGVPSICFMLKSKSAYFPNEILEFWFRAE